MWTAVGYLAIIIGGIALLQVALGESYQWASKRAARKRELRQLIACPARGVVPRKRIPYPEAVPVDMQRLMIQQDYEIGAEYAHRMVRSVHVGLMLGWL